ncbi:MAG: TonB-dependent receptor [bacterium]|nr:TonB-dependent receptor [bacterium]
MDPEIFKSFEIGIRRSFLKIIDIDVSVYYNSINNLISSIYVSPLDYGYNTVANDDENPARMHVNSGDAKSTLFGSQIFISVRNLIKSIKLNLDGGVTFTKGKEILPDSGGEINQARLVPSHMGKVRISMQPTKRLYLTLLNIWSRGWHRSFMPTSDYYEESNLGKVDGYYTLDVVAGFQFSKNIRAYIKIINCFDETYGGIDATGHDIDLHYNPQLGRNVRVGLTFQLN